MEAEVAERFRELKQHVAEHYASKLDIAKLREDMAVQFGQVNLLFAEMDAKMTRLESTIIKWFVATSFALVGATFAMARYLP
ncbi:hypothetical protein ASF61_03030 [Duganella sp. Leaf126]|uniref:hypothetical protein n=1 Tax=Duganella sp. Leaf126 TaxID=1736266 RepID=UPI0006F65A52|nr:hypothetical protein [Duganella sp. Leaf126]KQQ47618.1 hypothetical protein ASF61_03030 [Duganella sp. Leaf126]